MMRPSFDRWLRREIVRLAGADRFNLRKLAASAQGNNPRLLEPLYLYAYATDTLDRLYSLTWREEVLASYEQATKALNGADLSEAALRNEQIPDLPRDYSKFLEAYRVAYENPEIKAESKQLRWQRSHELQLQKGVSNAEIYHALSLNPGNVNAYMKHGALEKLSLANATKIMEYLFAYQPDE